MKDTKKFDNYAQYESWTEDIENRPDHEMPPVLIDDGWKLAMDMTTDCKCWQTALRRFRKAMAAADPTADVISWIDGMAESCESGLFQDTTGWRPAWTTDPKEIEKVATHGVYSWGVEELDEGRWYIFLNISGCYANREPKGV